MPRSTRSCLAIALFGTLLPQTAQAYLIDTNDATVVEHGRMALELQPVGYWQTVIGEEEHYLIAPSTQLYLGIAPDWDLIYLHRGWVPLDDAPDQSAYSLEEQMLALRAMLRHGRYSDGESEGPSVTFQAGVLLPGINAETGVGASAALLVAQQWDEATLHLNLWANLTQEHTFDLFVSAVVEGPGDWPVRPTVEVWFDLYDGDPTISGLAGLLIDVTDDFLFQGGVRVGGWEDYLEMEIRLSSWAAFDVFAPPSTEDEGDDDEGDDVESPELARLASAQLASAGPALWRPLR